jgi:uncharacterized protein (DUF1697 family)
MLRGVNVSGQKEIAMADLRELYSSLGFIRAATCIQSGNVLFNSSTGNTAQLTDKIAWGILGRFGYEVDVFIKTPAQMEAVVKNNPFGGERPM